jgi:hypothetical protein
VDAEALMRFLEEFELKSALNEARGRFGEKTGDKVPSQGELF